MPLVSNEPLRKRYFQLRAQGVSVGLMARRAGYKDIQHSGRPKGQMQADTAPLRRALGLQKAETIYRMRIQETTALRLCEALELDPREIGL